MLIGPGAAAFLVSLKFSPSLHSQSDESEPYGQMPNICSDEPSASYRPALVGAYLPTEISLKCDFHGVMPLLKDCHTVRVLLL